MQIFCRRIVEVQRSGTWAPSLPLVTLLWQHDDITSPPLQRPHELSMGVMTQWVDFQLVSHYHVSAACQKPQYVINWGGVDVSLKGEERGNEAIVQERCSANCIQVRHRIRSTVCVLSIQCPPCVWKHGLLRHAKRNIFCLIWCGFFVHSLCRWQQTVCLTSRCANIIEWAFQTVQPFKPFSIILLWWSLFSFCSIWSTNITIWLCVMCGFYWEENSHSHLYFRQRKPRKSSRRLLLLSWGLLIYEGTSLEPWGKLSRWKITFTILQEKSQFQ